MGIFGLFSKKKRKAVSENQNKEQKQEEVKSRLLYDENDTGMRAIKLMKEENIGKKVAGLEQLAKEGEEIAMKELGDMYLSGEQVPRDWNKAKQYYQGAMAKGLDDAKYMLAGLYINDPEDRTHLEDGLIYLSELAADGHEAAVMSIRDYSESPNVREAFEVIMQPYMEKVEKKQTGRDFLALGLLYMYGVYYETDLKKAKEHLETAASMGEYEAEYHLESILFED